MTDEEAQEAHREIMLLRAERDRERADGAKLRAALVKARPFIAVGQYVGQPKSLQRIPEVTALLAEIDAALGKREGE